jgi:sporulation protein YlmC with PRC-barrel domain
MTMRKLVLGSALALVLALPAVAQDVKILTSLPADAETITDYYKQNVYDPQNNKIGDIRDLLVEKDGKVVAAIVGVGGFLRMGEKDVAVPFNALKRVNAKELKPATTNPPTTANPPTNRPAANVPPPPDRFVLVMNATKDELKNAAGWKYDRTAGKWVPEDQKPATTGTNPENRNNNPPRKQ